MAITLYSELKTAVANWASRSDLTTRIPEFIALAEDWAAMNLRVRAMETTANITIDAQTEALPTGYVAMRRLYLSGNPVRKLDYLTPLNFWSKYASTNTAKPTVFTIEGENLTFGPAPDTTYTGKILYYKRFTALSADSDTNWLLTSGRGILLYGALAELFAYTGEDGKLLKWATMRDELAKNIMAADKRDRFSGDALVIQTDVGGP